MEAHVPEVLKTLEARLKEVTEEKERLERVIGGLHELYTKNGKAAARQEKVIRKATEKKGKPSSTGKGAGDYPKAEIEQMLLGGQKPGAVIKATGVQPHVVYGINHQLKKAGKIK